MSDAIEYVKELENHQKKVRAKFGVNCPQCSKVRPKANPTILLPQQRCRVDGYRDPRAELTNEQWSNA